MHVPFSNARNSWGIELHRRRFFLMPRSRWRERVGPPHCTHNLERERGSSSSLLPLSLPVCLGCTPRPQAPPSTLVCSTLSTLALPSIPNRRRRLKSPILASDQEFVQSISKNCRLAGYLRTSLEGGNESQVAC